MKYKYIEKNLLEEPENYFFSKYAGEDFVKSYFNTRADKIASLEKDINCNDSFLEEYLRKNKGSKNVNVEKIVSLRLLRYLLYKAIKDDIYSEKRYLDIFLKKYEVTKKIYTEYDSNFNVVNYEYNNMENYCLLSICCCLYYKKTKNLKYLNTTIKINDLLCSKEIIFDEEYKELVYKALYEEIQCVNQLFLAEGLL